MSVYSLPTWRCLSSFGNMGTDSQALFRPQKIAFSSSSGNLFISDSMNQRVQEIALSASGSPTFVGSYNVTGYPFGVASFSGLVLVGSATEGGGIVNVFDEASRKHLGSFHDTKQRAGGLRDPTCIRFRPQDSLLFVCENINSRVSAFEFVKAEKGGFSAQLVGYLKTESAFDPWDVEFSPKGDVVVADQGGNRLCIFTSTDSTPLPTSYRCHKFDSILTAPNALAVQNSRLFVLGYASANSLSIFDWQVSVSFVRFLVSPCAELCV